METGNYIFKLSIVIKHADFMVQSGEVAFENLTVLKILVLVSLAWNSLCLS